MILNARRYIVVIGTDRIGKYETNYNTN
jgi:hypothetical protein